MNTAALNTEVEILSRIIGPQNPDLTRDAAQSILKLKFSDSDINEMNRLAANARNGTLTEADEGLLHGYRLVGAIIDLMHSKARISLRDSNPHAA